MDQKLAACFIYGDKYSVDRLGNVYRTKTRGGSRCFRPVKWLIKHGYAHVCLSSEHKKKWVQVHRLVAFAFIGPPPDGRPTVNHLDGNKLNNDVENLEWASHSRQIKHSVEIGLRDKPVPPVKRGEENHNSPLTALDVAAIRDQYADGATSRRIGSKYGVSKTAILNIVKRKSWSHI